MTSEKKSLTEDSAMTDYANLAFNPYAISTDDLTFGTFGSPGKNGKPMENGGFEMQSEVFVEENPHYEDTAEVAKKAGLSGPGRRKKENVVYEAAGFKKKPKSEKRPEAPEPSRIRSLNLPQRPAEKWSGISKTSDTRWKLPFVILCLLVLVCLTGSVLGVLAYLHEKKCSCNQTPQAQTEPLSQGGNTSRLVDVENEFTKNIREIFGKLDTLNAALDALERKQMDYEGEFTQNKASMNTIQQELNSALQTINSTLNIKLKNVNSNVSSLSRDLDEFNTELRSVNNFSRQLSNTLEDINSTFTAQIRNISKEMGPRGLNGSQGLTGPRGPQGIGNISACIVGEKKNRNQVRGFPDLLKTTIIHSQTPGWKVISAVCSTKEKAGTIHTVLSRNGDDYVCTCTGIPKTGAFEPLPDEDGDKFIECVIIYWECPELT